MNSTDLKLTAENVHNIVLDCLFREGEDTASRIIGDAIVSQFGFHPERLKSHEEDIRALLAQLPDDFHSTKGGGMSFLNACVTRDGEQWGEHRNMGELFALGTASGLAKSLMPREMWAVLPGGMPYYSVL